MIVPAVTLLIYKSGGDWIAQVANTSISYTFAGNDEATQIASVRALSTAMQSGEDATIQVVRTVFSDVPAAEQDFLVVENLFSGTEALEVAGGASYVVAEEGVDLLAELVEVGEFLAVVAL